MRAEIVPYAAGVAATLGVMWVAWSSGDVIFRALHPDIKAERMTLARAYSSLPSYIKPIAVAEFLTGLGMGAHAANQLYQNVLR